MKIKLQEIAHARSGDKGPNSNVGLIFRHPEIYDCLVVGIEDKRFGQKVVALASYSGDNQTSEADLISYSREHLAGYKLPKNVIFVPEVARAPNGKANYKWAKEIAESTLL